MDDFILQLIAQLNRDASEEQINKDLIELAKTIEKLKVQAEIDPNSVKNITQQLASILSKKVVVDNVQVDPTKVSKAGEQTAKTFGSSFSNNLKSSLNDIKYHIQDVIKEFSNNKLSSIDLSSKFNLNRPGLDVSVKEQVRNLTTEINSLATEVIKTNSDTSWEGIITKVNSLYKVLQQFGAVRDNSSFEESLGILDHFKNKSIFAGNKSEVFANTGMNVRELNNQFKNLGVTFTTATQNSIKLDSVWDELFNISPGLSQFENYAEQLSAIVNHLKLAKEAKYGEGILQPVNSQDINNVLGQYIIDLENAAKKVNILQSEQSELEQSITQSSTSTANTVIQNEQKKQRAIQETTNAYKALSESESIVKSGAGVTTFDGTNNAAKEAQRYFQELLKDEQAVIATTEKFGENNNLTSFAVNIKRASGEVETLRYTLDTLKDDEGNIVDTFYRLSGSSIGDAGAIKQIQQIENAFADFTQKLAQFKSTNSEILSGLTAPLSDFESKLAGLKNGTNTINEVTNAYKSLNTEASNITANFSRQLSPTDSAIRNIAKGEETISGLRAEIKGLNNAPIEINSELNRCASLLSNIKKIESEQGRTAEWSAAYREYSDAIDNVKAKLNTLKKEQANASSEQIFNVADLEKQGKVYTQKVANTVEKIKPILESKLKSAGYVDIEIKGTEKANGQIKSLTANVTDATGAFKQLNFERAKIQGDGKAQAGFIQTDDVKVLGNISTSIAKTQDDLTGLKSKWEEQRVLVGEFKDKVEQLEASLSSVGNKGELDNLKGQIQSLKTEASTIAQANEIQLSLDTGEYDTKILGLETSLEKLGLSSSEVADKMKGVTTAFNELKINTAGENIIPDNVIAKAETLDNEISKLSNTIKQIKFDESLTADNLKVEQTIIRLNNQLQANGRYSQEAKTQIKEWILELQKGNVAQSRLKQINVEAKQLHSTMASLNQTGTSFFDNLKSKLGSLGTYLSAATVLSKSLSAVRDGISSVVNLDTALVDLRKTANMTAQELEDFYYASNDVAKQMGVTTEEILKQASAWSRLGFSTADQATQMAKYSSMFAMISPGMDIDAATDGLVSMMKAFKIGADDVSEVVDGIMSKVNVIGNTRALNNSDIVEFLTRSSSAMAEANNTLEETIALGTAMVEITRDAANAGQVLKTVSMRIRGYDEETEEYIGGIEELTGKIADLTKTASTPGGISLFTDASKTEYKSTVQLLREISEIYDQLKDKDQAALLEVLAGKRNGQAIAAALNNWSAVEDSLNSMANSAGNAEAELSIAMDSISFKANALKETATGIAQNLFQREDMKNILDVLNTFASGIDKATEKLGLFGTAAAGLGLFAGIKNVGMANYISPPSITCCLSMPTA